jgi:TrmH family RNA methyltransferase
MISIILLEPENAGNVGAVARSMANFGFKDLILIDPKCDPKSRDAIRRAKFAGSILKKAKIRTKKVLDRFDYVIATTAKLGNDYNIPRSPISPKQFAEKVAVLKKKKTKIGILFGREGIGLTNEEVRACDFVVTIPSSKSYGTLNISHAVNILLYELFVAFEKPTISSHIVMASSAEKKQLLKLFNKVLNSLNFATPAKKQTQVTVWRRIMGKSFLTKREAFALMGFFKKLIKK